MCVTLVLCLFLVGVFFFKQKTAYEMRISDWSSDVCSSDLVTYIEHSGKQHDLELDDGTSVMDGAISHLVKGIVGECGGGLACATCHCYVDEAWLDRVSPPSDAEKEMLEGVAGETIGRAHV